MSTRIVSPPFIVFEDIDGEPLQSGYIYLGLPGLNPQVSPISVYSDAALTVPLAQPLRTIAGYVSSNGTPSKVYVDGDFSITVLNRNSTLVYTSLTGNGLSTGDTFTREETIAISEGAAFASVVPLEIRNIVDAQYFYDEADEIAYAALIPLSGSISSIGVAAAGVLAVVLDGVSVKLFSPSLAHQYDVSFKYAVGQLAGGNSSLVGFIYAGQTIDPFEYVVYPNNGQIFSRGAVTGTMAGDFNPATGVDSGITGTLEQISDYSSPKDWTSSVVMSDSNKTLSIVENTYGRVVLTGTLTAARNLIVSSLEKNLIVVNNTTGGFQVKVKTLSGTGVNVPNGGVYGLRCDGANILTLGNNNEIQVLPFSLYGVGSFSYPPSLTQSSFSRLEFYGTDAAGSGESGPSIVTRTRIEAYPTTWSAAVWSSTDTLNRYAAYSYVSSSAFQINATSGSARGTGVVGFLNDGVTY
tara:strand:- start:5474 stop:6874 length:1401 start_codon:yes stop_codon:yes gene_type:complete